MAATRLYVGGLGERVTENDLRTTFSHLGSVQSLDFIRTKGRCFAYIDFLPGSDNSLAKLFSTYNGCSWKGGKLKLEKAKQHYIDRLKQEWEEDAELKISEDAKLSVVDETPPLKSTLDLEKMQLHLFFPKLRKVKSLPLRGTGKHKYSFQRVQVPPLPRLFCDCPEHCDPIDVTRLHNTDLQNGKINDQKIKTTNSVMNRFLDKGTSSIIESIQPSMETHDHDIQDGGMNDEEINVMNSVMKKLLDRETAKTQRKELHESSQTFVPTNIDKMDEETDDEDDIKINVGSGQNVGYDSWETSLVNKMAGSNVRRTSYAGDSKLDSQNRKVTPPNKKRKSASNKSDDKDPASPVQRKRVHFETQSNEAEENLELKGVKESKTKNLVTSDTWSQKSSWKALIGDGRSGSFQLPNITLGDQAVHVEEPKSGGETSSDNEGIKRVCNAVKIKHKTSIKTSADREELERVRNSVHENVNGKPLTSIDTEAAQSVEPSPDLIKVARGSSWLQKSSWTQLVGGGSSSSFSISQILPGDVLGKRQLSESKDDSTPNNFYSSDALVIERGTNGKAFGGTTGSRFGFGGNKKRDTQASDARNIQCNEASKEDRAGSSITKKLESEKNKVSSSQPETGISETCLFMRSDESLKEWQTLKTALNKKKSNNQ